MPVISKPPPAPVIGWATSSHSPPVAPAAFVMTQASWLRRGLLHADDPVTVAVVIGSHNLSHERWLSLIAHVRATVSIEAAVQVMALYELHGRLVEGLEHHA